MITLVFQEIMTVKVETTSKKRKTLHKVAESDAENNDRASPVVRRTRGSQMIQQVILYITCAGIMVYLLIGKCFC